MILPPCVSMNKVMDQNIINEYGLHVFHWSYIINLRLATVSLEQAIDYKISIQVYFHWGFILNPRSMIFWLLPSSW